MDLEEIKELIQLMEKTGTSRLMIKKGDQEIELERGMRPANPMQHELDVHRQSAAPRKGNAVTSPMVGTFYNSSSSENPPFVRVGDRVAKGDILCIVEAMKVMNEIKADGEGIVRAIFVENGAPVEFGTPLFEIE